ncbi:MAG: hypothetical protein ACW98I_09460 [Candidatus Hodarchaeales archaeon]|jgi:hypothetical protein
MNLSEQPPKDIWRCVTPESPRKDSDSFLSIVVCGYGIGRERGITELVHAFAYIYPSSSIEKKIEYTNDYYGKTVEYKVTGFSVQPPHFTHPVEVWDLSREHIPLMRDERFISFFLGIKTAILLYHSLEFVNGYNTLKDDWLPKIDDMTPRFLVETDYMEFHDEIWFEEHHKKRPPKEAQKAFNGIKRFFCKVRDTQCTRELCSNLLDFLSNISPKDE